MDIIINLALIAFLGFLYYRIWARKREKKQAAQRILAALNQMTKQWKDVVESIAMAQIIADTEEAATAAAEAAAN